MLEAANVSLRDSRRAALDLMEDALTARQRAERASAELRQEVAERQRVEAALRQNDAEPEEAQQLSHIGSWYWDAKTDVTTASDELYRIYGLDMSQPFPDFREQRGRCSQSKTGSD